MSQNNNNNNISKKTSVSTRRGTSSARRETSAPVPDMTVENFPPLPAPAAPRGRLAATTILASGGIPSGQLTSNEVDEFMEIDELCASSASSSSVDDSETPVLPSNEAKQPESFEVIETNAPVDIKKKLNDRKQALLDQLVHIALQISVVSDLSLLKSLRKQRAEMKERLTELEGTYFDMYGEDETVETYNSTPNTRDESSNSSIPMNQGHIYQPMSFVPSNLPFFQWSGFVCDTSRRVFKTPHQCIRAFENVLTSHSLSIEDNWLRIIHVTAPEQIMDWINEFPETNPKASWKVVKDAMSLRFGMSPERVRQLATDNLYRLSIRNNESMHQYVERFRQLTHEAQMSDDAMKKYCLLKPVPVDLHAAVIKTIRLSVDPHRESLEYMIKVLLSIDEANNDVEIQKKRASQRKMQSPKRFTPPRFSPSSRFGSSRYEASSSKAPAKA